MDDTIQTLKERFDNLPLELQAVISDPNTINTIKNICEKYSVDPQKVAGVENEIYIVLFGFEPTKTLRTNLVENVAIPYDQAIKISLDANDKIFTPVGDILEDISNMLQNLPVTERSETTVSKQPTTTQHAPDNLIPDHEQMTRTDGPHLHSQKTMPLSSQTATATFTQATPAQPTQAAPTQPLPTKSVVDQKLGGMVRSASSIFGFREVKDNTQNTTAAPATTQPAATTPTQPLRPVEAAKSAPASYNGNDPYREPLI